MLTRAQLIGNEEKLLDKVYGCLIGLAIGDSLGDAARLAENRANYGITTDFNKGASWSTDDTEFALLTAQTIIAHGKNLEQRHVVDAWMQHVVGQDEYKRGGASETEAAQNLRRGLLPPDSGRCNTFQMSDGAVMRIAPIGAYCAGDPQEAARLAYIEANISHARDGIWGAQAVAAAVAVAMADGDIDQIMDAAWRQIPEDSWLFLKLQRAFGILDDCDNAILDLWMPLHDELRTASWATTAEALPSAFCCLKLRHESFREGVVLAANFARDADTIGAVCGAVLGAKYGASGIPERWREKVRYPSGTCLLFTKGMDIYDIATRLTRKILEDSEA